jgi:hypothetical protein
MRRWIDNVNGFTYPHDTLLVDNSSSDAFYSRYKSEVPMLHYKGDAHMGMRNVTHSMEMIRQRFLTQGYDFWFNIEIDVLPQIPDVIERMLEFAVSFEIVNHAYPSRTHSDIDHQGVGCAMISRNLAQNINYDTAGDVSPDAWLWSKVRKRTTFKMIDLWNVFPILHIVK